MIPDWSKYPNFKEYEFECRHTGLCDMQPEFMARLQKLRDLYEKPMVINSGYRHETHPVHESVNMLPGELVIFR